MTFFVFVIKIDLVVLLTRHTKMQKKWRQYQQINEALHKRFGNRLIKKQNKGRRADKAFNLSNKISQNLLYLGEILVVGIFSFSTLIFGNGITTPNNVKLVYPLQEVSTLDCRHQDWANLSDACKVELPIIENADYPRYEGQRNYTDIYTVLFGGNYKNGWAINEGSHYGIDIASAKGTPLYAIANGKVYFAGTQAGYGNVVKIQFVYNGVMYFATYGHMDQILVKTGQPVSIGQKL